jgi:hypothetical protein
MPRYVMGAFATVLAAGGPMAARIEAPVPVVAAKEWWHAFGMGKLSSRVTKTGFPFRFATTMEIKDKAREGAERDPKELES